MKIPSEVPVMTLPNATLFPQALLPLYIFEPRYRQMLADCLESDHRMFAVAMQKQGVARPVPSAIGGLGLIRVAVRRDDGTSHLILQGLARVELQETIRTRPYRLSRIRALETPPCDNVRVDALVAKLRELIEERIDRDLPFPEHLFPSSPPASFTKKAAALSPKDILKFLDSVADPGQAADLVSCAVLPSAAERQAILETISVESRLRHLIRFLLFELEPRRKNGDAA